MGDMMASIMIHICVAKKVNEYLKLPEKKLYLGTLAPDLSKELNDSRNLSHFYDGETIDIDKFIDKYKYKLWDPYIMGYFIHLVTDKIWEEDFVPKFIKQDNIKLQQGGMSIASSNIINRLIYEDATNLASVLIDKYEPKLSLFFDEIELPKITVDEIDTSKLEVLINKMSTIVANSKQRKPLIFNWEDIIEFIESMSVYIVDYIKKHDL